MDADVFSLFFFFFNFVCAPWLQHLLSVDFLVKGERFIRSEEKQSIYNDGHSDQCEVVPHCSSDLHFSSN